MLNGRTELHIFDRGSVIGDRYCEEVLLPHVPLFRGVIGPDFIFMNDNARPHWILAVEKLLESEDITRMDWPAYSLDITPIEHVWDALGRRIEARLHHPDNTQQLKQILIEEWALLPQEMLHQLVLSLRSRCEATIAVRGGLEEGRSVTSVAAEFGFARSIVSRLWRQFQTTGTAIRGFSSGRQQGTTPADYRYIVVQARRNRRQTAGKIARHTTQATGRPISRFTVARRLHGGGLFSRRPVRCVPLTPAHRKRRSLWCREHRNWRYNEWGRVLFADDCRFSLSIDSHRILIWRERGSRNHPSNIIERDRYGGRGVLVWGGIILGSRTDRHIFDAGSVNGTRYCNEILLPYVRLFRGAMGLQFLFMDDNTPCHRTVAAEQLLESRRLAARTLPPVTFRELRLALQDEWAAMPQQFIDNLILSMGRRCETCLAVRGDPISY
ncbi:transposable element Tcb2 transposase [Trichonephila clavipes]|nr:transposable element Tcb2 transposase [Trichonephila clavipes]